MGAGLGVVITIAVMAGTGPTGRSSPPTVEYRPGPEVPRWTGQPVDVAGVGLVADFDADDSSIYLLDSTNREIVVVDREAGWAVSRTIGGPGAGPGEFLSAQGVALTADGSRVVVSDDSRLHVFAAAGEYLHSSAIGTSCRLLRPRVAAAARGFFVSGNCYRVGPVTDTMTSVLYWTPDGERYTEIASDVRFTRDGRLGSFMSAVSALSESASIHLFGTGSSECVHEIVESHDGPPAARRACGIVARRYSAPPPPAFAARLRAERARRGGETLMSWPDPLPVYMDRLVAGGRQLLLRPFTADSLVFEESGSGLALLVAGMDGLVACRRQGCLWSEATVTGSRLRLLDAAEIARLFSRQ
jgi:hypothetical protein